MFLSFFFSRFHIFFLAKSVTYSATRLRCSDFFVVRFTRSFPQKCDKNSFQFTVFALYLFLVCFIIIFFYFGVLRVLFVIRPIYLFHVVINTECICFISSQQNNYVISYCEHVSIFIRKLVS